MDALVASLGGVDRLTREMPQAIEPLMRHPQALVRLARSSADRDRVSELARRDLERFLNAIDPATDPKLVTKIICDGRGDRQWADYAAALTAEARRALGRHPKALQALGNGRDASLGLVILVFNELLIEGQRALLEPMTQLQRERLLIKWFEFAALPLGGAGNRDRLWNVMLTVKGDNSFSQFLLQMSIRYPDDWELLLRDLSIVKEQFAQDRSASRLPAAKRVLSKMNAIQMADFATVLSPEFLLELLSVLQEGAPHLGLLITQLAGNQGVASWINTARAEDRATLARFPATLAALLIQDTRNRSIQLTAIENMCPLVDNREGFLAAVGPWAIIAALGEGETEVAARWIQFLKGASRLSDFIDALGDHFAAVARFPTVLAQRIIDEGGSYEQQWQLFRAISLRLSPDANDKFARHFNPWRVLANLPEDRVEVAQEIIAFLKGEARPLSALFDQIKGSSAGVAALARFPLAAADFYRSEPGKVCDYLKVLKPQQVALFLERLKASDAVVYKAAMAALFQHFSPKELYALVGIARLLEFPEAVGKYIASNTVSASFVRALFGGLTPAQAVLFFTELRNSFSRLFVLRTFLRNVDDAGTFSNETLSHLLKLILQMREGTLRDELCSALMPLVKSMKNGLLRHILGRFKEYLKEAEEKSAAAGPGLNAQIASLVDLLFIQDIEKVRAFLKGSR